jgi:hypothetical protein
MLFGLLLANGKAPSGLDKGSQPFQRLEMDRDCIISVPLGTQHQTWNIAYLTARLSRVDT